MSDSDSNKQMEIQRLRRLLNDLVQLAEHSSLTGVFSEGAPRAVRRYNAVLQQLESAGAVPKGLFELLDENATFDEMGVDSKLLMGYLASDSPNDHREHHERRRIMIGGIDAEDLADLKDLGRTIRENLPTWMRGTPPVPPSPPSPPQAPVSPGPPAPPHAVEAILEIEEKHVEAEERRLEAEERRAEAEERRLEAERRLQEVREQLREAQERLSETPRSMDEEQR